MNLRATRLTLGLCVGLLALSRQVAATPQDQAMAEALFREGKTSFEKKDYAVACRKFEDSYKLDPAGGTQFALAVCYEASGRVASAWVQFQAVSSVKGARADRVETARAKAAALESKLPRVVIDLAKDAKVDGLEVRNDGTLIGASSFGTPLPVDPGAHKLSVTAPGRIAREETYEIAVGERRAISIRPLEATPAAKPTAEPTATTSAPPPSLPPPAPSVTETPSSGSKQRTFAFVAGGVGIVGVGIGAFFGLKARSKAGTANDKCPGATCDDDSARTAIADGQSAARVSNIAFALGGVGLAAGAVLWLTAPSKESAQLRVAPAIGSREGGLILGGTFQ